jgi:DNA-binding transcriptional LysR family regulator
MVIGGIGVALLPASAVSKEAARGELRIVELADVGTVASRVVGVSKGDGGEDTAVSRLLAAVCDVAARIRQH